MLKMFGHLSTCRRYQGGPIPWVDLVYYLDRLDYGTELSNTLEYIIRLTDVGFLEILEKERPKSKGKI